MAGRWNQDRNIQDAVLRVVENLHSLNHHQPTPLGPSTSAVSATVMDELNTSFQILHRLWPWDSSKMNENESGIHLARNVAFPLLSKIWLLGSPPARTIEWCRLVNAEDARTAPHTAKSVTAKNCELLPNWTPKTFVFYLLHSGTRFLGVKPNCAWLLVECMLMFGTSIRTGKRQPWEKTENCLVKILGKSCVTWTMCIDSLILIDLCLHWLYYCKNIALSNQTLFPKLSYEEACSTFLLWWLLLFDDIWLFC